MTGLGASEVELDYLPRIEAATRELKEALELRKTATRRRNELIVAAYESGVSQGAIAKAAGVGQSRIIAILSEPPDTDEDGLDG